MLLHTPFKVSDGEPLTINTEYSSKPIHASVTLLFNILTNPLFGTLPETAISYKILFSGLSVSV